ncbi:hypothetical protein UA08_03161 [Talaromyces atroroseus]|uniref:Basic proline-rich protein n=1 Tax=Talaromyces atroroseus TaxID=1441469 RepID=A0A225B2U4_TALAT|nr:hypothetical protein UA08_03161 [Talaromyces atroroseus]OKL61596.1 hypothetical protein UA08_03161 [Talaromyces atroroseus]
MMTESHLSPEQIRLPPSPTGTPPSSTGKPLGDGVRSVPPLLTTSSSSPRNHSPLSRTHSRSRSLASSFPVQMTRAHSSPGIDSRGRYVYPPNAARPQSPMEYSIRKHSPLRATDDMRTWSMGSLNISETISEHAELELPHTALPVQTELQQTATPLPPSLNTFSQPTRQQSTSSLRSNVSGVTGSSSSSPGSVHSSPIILATKFNEPYPSFTTSSTSSVPSTPTSLRSRSPSISSLETIPDIPDAEADAEAQAIEADEVARLKIATDGADTDIMRRRSNLESSISGSTRGYGTRAADKRKRWSVCGAERRQDLDLETIWED